MRVPAGSGRTPLVRLVTLPAPRLRGTTREVRGLPWLTQEQREQVAWDQLRHRHAEHQLVSRHTTAPRDGRVCAVRESTGEVLVAVRGHVVVVQPDVVRVVTEEPLTRCTACTLWRHVDAPCWDCVRVVRVG